MSFSLASTSAFRRCRSFFSRSSWTRLARAIWSAPRMCPLNSARSSSGVAPGSGTSFWRTPVTLTMNSLPALWMLRARSSPASFALCSCCSDSVLADGSRSTINAPPQPGHCFHAAAHFLHLVIWHLWQLAWCATWHSSHRVWSCWIAVCMSLHHSCSFCQAVPSSWMISSASGRATSSSGHANSSWILAFWLHQIRARRGCSARNISSQPAPSTRLPFWMCSIAYPCWVRAFHSHLPTPRMISTGNMPICAEISVHPSRDHVHWRTTNLKWRTTLENRLNGAQHLKTV